MYNVLLFLPLLALASGEEVHVRVSEPATLACPHNTAECGDIHSMKWYRDKDRVFVYSPFSDFSNPEAFLIDRSTVEESESSSDLIISGSLPTDDGEYRCEITYMDVSAACQSVFEYSLVTTALPASVSVGVGEDPVLEVTRPDLGAQHGVVGPYTFETEVEFFCAVEEVKPSAQIAWTLAGQQIEATHSTETELDGGAVNLRSTVNLALAREHLAATLACRVTFEDEVVAELSVELDIEVAPVELELDVPDLAAGEEGQLVCRITGGRPQATITWSGLDGIDFESIRSDKEVLEDDLTFTQTSTLTLAALPEHNQQTVSCSAEHQALDEAFEESAELYVAYAPVVVLEADAVETVEGEAFQLRCQFDANPKENASVFWFLNSEELSEDADEDVELAVNGDGVDTLVFAEITRGRAGEYRCSVTNEQGEGHSEPAILDVLYGPSVDLVLEGSEVDEGARVELSCPFTANPHDSARVTWIYNDEELSDEADAAVVFGANDEGVDTLVLDPVHRGQTGEYLCSVTNSIGEAPSHPVYIDVQYAPTVMLEWESDLFIEGDRLELLCPYSANPSNNSFVTWYFNSVAVSDDDASMMLGINGDGIDILVLESLNQTAAGAYECRVGNELGEAVSNTLLVDVLYAPDMELVVSPVESMVEGSEDNITLTCSLVAGNPANLSSVDWFLYGEQLETESECTDQECLLYIDAMRSSAGNYSCRGNNLAGPGPQESVLIDILYIPGPGLVVIEGEVEKEGNTTLQCEVEDSGNPAFTSYAWQKDGQVIEGEEGEYLLLEDLSLASEANYSCGVSNEVGINFGEAVFLQVSAAPAMILSPPTEVHMTEDYQWINLTCQVECSPLCEIDWYMNFVKITGGELLVARSEPVREETDVELFKDYEASDNEGSGLDVSEGEAGLYVAEELIDEDGQGPFTIFNEEIPSDIEALQFESLRSVLSIMMGNRTREMITVFQLANFTCSVAREETENDDDSEDLLAAEEEEVTATTMLIIEHSPQDVELSPDIEEISVVEGEDLDQEILCSALAVPEPQIAWKLNDDVVSSGDTLKFSDSISRSDGGEYSCEASNEYGSEQKSFQLDVQYAPTCFVSVEETEEENLTVLKCTAVGNPQDFLFWWSREGVNYDGQMQDEYSTISLKNVNESVLPLYTCHANNTIGQSQPCALLLPGSVLNDDVTLIVVIVVVIVVLLLIALLVYLKCCRNNAPKGAEKLGVSQPKEKKPKKKEDSFYDNLPFHGLKNPPKQVLTSPDDGLVYADVDAEQIYSQGPVGYNTASLQRAKQKKKLLEESKV